MEATFERHDVSHLAAYGIEHSPFRQALPPQLVERTSQMTDALSRTIPSASVARLEELLDRQDILACLQRISRAIDRFDRELFLSGFHSDAIIDAGEFVGPPELVYEGGRQLHETGQSATLHNLMNHTCDLQGEAAHTETYFLYTGRNHDGSNWLAGGRYVDRLERRDGAWKVAFRCTLLEWSSVIPGAAVPLFDNTPDAHLNGAPSRTLADPSYQRPLINRRALSCPDNPRELSAPRT